MGARGIPVERKGIYDDIKVLNYFYQPTDKRKMAKATRVEKDEEGRGFYLDNRLFSVADLKVMMDAIQSSKFLSEAKTLELIETLETLCSKHQARGLKRQVIVTNRVKNMNTSIHNNVGHVNYAIENDEQLRFKYFDYDVKQERAFRKKGGFYIVSPYALVYCDDKHHLGCVYRFNAKEEAGCLCRTSRQVPSTMIWLLDLPETLPHFAGEIPQKHLYIVVAPHPTYNICYIRDVLLFPTMKPID